MRFRKAFIPVPAAPTRRTREISFFPLRFPRCSKYQFAKASCDGKKDYVQNRKGRAKDVKNPLSPFAAAMANGFFIPDFYTDFAPAPHSPATLEPSGSGQGIDGSTPLRVSYIFRSPALRPVP